MVFYEFIFYRILLFEIYSCKLGFIKISGFCNSQDEIRLVMLIFLKNCIGIITVKSEPIIVAILIFCLLGFIQLLNLAIVVFPDF